MKQLLITIAAVLLVGCGNPEADKALFKAIRNGKIEMVKEAIYGTTSWTTLNEGGLNDVIGKGTGHRPEKGFENNFTSEHFWFTLRPG